MVAELDTQEPVEDAIFAEVHGSRYTLAQGALICREKLFEDFGYLADTAAAEEVLNGSMPQQEIYSRKSRQSDRQFRRTQSAPSSHRSNGNGIGR